MQGLSVGSSEFLGWVEIFGHEKNQFFFVIFLFIPSISLPHPLYIFLAHTDWSCSDSLFAFQWQTPGISSLANAKHDICTYNLPDHQPFIDIQNIEVLQIRPFTFYQIMREDWAKCFFYRTTISAI